MSVAASMNARPLLYLLPACGSGAVARVSGLTTRVIWLSRIVFAFEKRQAMVLRLVGRSRACGCE